MKLNKLFMIIMSVMLLLTASSYAMDITIDGCIKPQEKNDNSYNAYLTITNNDDSTLKEFRTVFDINNYDDGSYIWHKDLNFKKIKPGKVKKYKKTILNDRMMRFFIIKGQEVEQLNIDKDFKVCPEPETPVETPVKKKKSKSSKIELKQNEYKTFKTISVKTRKLGDIYTKDNKVCSKYGDKEKCSSNFDSDSFIKGIEYKNTDKYSRLKIKYENDGSIYFDTDIPEVKILVYNKWFTLDTTKDYKIIQ